MAFTVDIRGNASHLEKTLKSAKGSIARLGSVATAGVTGLAALGAAGAAGLTAFVVSSSKAASNVESLTMQFETLLGGADAAGKRMEDIVKFAASTPFEIPELAATSKLLQVMGGDLLATGDGLRMVGDAAAIAGQPLQEVGLHIGRVFNAITSGTSAGESVARLQELGLITGTVKREFEDLAAAQKKGTVATLTSQQALAKLRGILSQTDGAMARLAATTEGKLSNMKDNIGQLQVAFGTGFNAGLRDALDATNNFLPQLESKLAESGSVIGSAISQAVQGNTAELANIGALAGEFFFEGFKAFYLRSLDGLLAGVENAALGDRSDPLGVGRLIDKLGMPNPLGDRKGIIKGAQAAPLSQYLETAAQNVTQSGAMQTINETAIANGIAEGLRKGEISAGMREEVRKGIMDAWQKDPNAGRAKFSN
jgi:hypothetical protein